jgi:uncharacterized peroxidase-related enzyme
MGFLKEVPLDEKSFAPYAGAQEMFGFIPNLFRAQSLRPDLIEAESALVWTILLKEKALARAQKEYIFLVCSAANLSTYCVTAHCEIVRGLGLSGPRPEQIAVDHNHTDLPVSDKALLNFALKLNRQSSGIAQKDIQGLRTYGFTDEQILEAVVTVGLAKFANLLSFGFGAVPDFEPNLAALPSGQASSPRHAAEPVR